MGQACANCGGFKEMQEDIKKLKEVVKLLNGNMGTIEKGTSMIEAQLPIIDNAKGMLQTKVNGLISQVDQVSTLTDGMSKKVDEVEQQILNKVPQAKQYM